MNIKKPLLVAGVASTIVLGGVSGAGVVSAATDNSTSSADPTNSLADKIASKFNLNKDEVKAVFDQDRSERHAGREQKLEERLNQAVTDGKITSTQKDQILAKVAELKAYRESIADKDRSEQRTLMKAKMDEVKTWAEQNNIPKQYLRFGGGHGGHGGPGGPRPEADTSPNTN